MSIMLFTIKDKKIVPTDDISLNEEQIYIIIDFHAKRSKIWIWSGSKVNKMDRYFAGVSATKLKTQKKLYGASIEVVESGKEPNGFPDLANSEIIQETEEEPQPIKGVPSKPELKPQKEPEPEPEPEIESEEQIKPEPEIEIESELNTPEKTQITDRAKREKLKEELSQFKLKLNSFFKEITRELNNIQKKIEDFSTNI